MGDVVSTVVPALADVAAVATGGILTPLAVAANLGTGIYDATQGNWLGAAGSTLGAGLGAGGIAGGLGGAAGEAAGAAAPAAATTAADVASTAAPALGAGAGLSAAGLGATDALSYPLVSDVAAGSGDIFGLGSAPLVDTAGGLGAGVSFGSGLAGTGEGAAGGAASGAAGAAAPASETGPATGLGANLGGGAGPSSGDLMGLPGGGGAAGLGGGVASPAGGDLMGLPTGGTAAPSFSSQFTGAGPGDAAGFVSSPDNIAFTGGATGIPAEGSTLFGIPLSDITKGLGVAGSLGGIAKQFMAPNVPNTGALKDLAGQIASSNAGLASAAQGFLNQGQALQAPLMSGAPLPTGAATQVDQALQGAEAAIRSRYASMGQSGSSAEQQALLAARQSAASQKFQIEQSLAQQGLSTAQTGASILGGAQGGATTAANIYQQLIANAMGQDQALQGAIGRFASAVG